jgi:hypothetical protein
MGYMTIEEATLNTYRTSPISKLGVVFLTDLEQKDNA